jgi:hypothetical protein
MRALVTPGVRPTIFTELPLEDSMKAGVKFIELHARFYR